MTYSASHWFFRCAACFCVAVCTATPPVSDFIAVPSSAVNAAQAVDIRASDEASSLDPRRPAPRTKRSFFKVPAKSEAGPASRKPVEPSRIPRARFSEAVSRPPQPRARADVEARNTAASDQAVESILYPQCDDSEIRHVFSEGVRLEQERNWLEAMRHYEKSLKTFAEHRSLHDRYRAARFHYEISKRYHDASFSRLMESTPLSELLEMYGDAFSRLHDYHVDAPQWESLFRYGLEDLEIALYEEEFLSKNDIRVSPERIRRVCEKMREISEPWSFRHIHDMKNGVLCLAELAQKEIGLSPAAVILEFICGASFSLDPHTSYFTLRQLDDFTAMIDGCYVGIGVELDDEQTPLLVRKVHPRSPAQAAGVKQGDRIIAVNGTEIEEMPFEQAADLLQGGIGSTVTLQLKSRGEASREVRIKRGDVEIASVEDVRMIDGEMGYIRLTCFQPSSADEMREALNTLHARGMKSLVLDLRRNPGGLLSIAVEIADLFIERGVIVRTQDRSSRAETVWRASPPGTWKMPLYVLIDEESASASEIFAGAIQEHKRGLVIGYQSYGKGTVQIIYRLTGSEPAVPLSGLKLTVERFYSPNGTPFCNVGVVPDLKPLDAASEPSEEKTTLAKPEMTETTQERQNASVAHAPEESVVAGVLSNAKPGKRKMTPGSGPDDPFVAAAMSANYRDGNTDPLRLSQTRP